VGVPWSNPNKFLGMNLWGFSQIKIFGEEFSGIGKAKKIWGLAGGLWRVLNK
jgi:hypothetical protein